jgi:hypothetical protein
MGTEYALILFLALSSAPDAADRMTVTDIHVRSAMCETKGKGKIERSTDGWRMLRNREPELVNRRDDRLFLSATKDAPRVTAYLAALDKTECDACGKSLPLESLDFPGLPKKTTCDVHGEIPGYWIDMAQYLEKPEDGWPRAGKLRFHGLDRRGYEVWTEFKTAIDGNGLDFDFIRVAPDGSRQEIGLWKARVEWSKAKE